LTSESEKQKIVIRQIHSLENQSLLIYKLQYIAELTVDYYWKSEGATLSY